MPALNLPYEKFSLEAVIPDGIRVETLMPATSRGFDDPGRALCEALDSPVGSPPLGSILQDKPERVLIIVPDHTRVCGRERLVPMLLDLLNRGGIPDDRIRVIVASGSHVHPPEDRFRESVGKAVDRIEVIKHDPEGPMTDHGTTSRGTPVRVNAILDEADLIIPSTAVVHHYFAGFGGGRKIFVPGLASLDTIAANHALTFDTSGKVPGRHALVFSGSLDGNPVHEDMLEAAQLVLKDKRHFALVSVILPDRQFGFFSAGNLDSSHRRACEFADASNGVDIDGLADVVIASAGGAPKDGNIVQSHKGMDNAVRALKPGGTLLYVMSCFDGPGHQAITDFATLDLDAVRQRLRENYIVYGQTVYAIKEKSRTFRIVLVSGLENDLVRSLGFEPASDIQKAVSMIDSELTSAGLVYHLPRADITVPRGFPTH